MPITRLDIFNNVNFFLKKENKFFTSSDVLTIINRDAFRRIAEDVMYPRASYSGALTSGAYLISTPADFIKIANNANITFKDATPKETRTKTVRTFRTDSAIAKGIREVQSPK
jgi:hypothetical protein